MGENLAGQSIRKIVRRGTEKAPFKRISVEASGKVAVVSVHTVKPDTFEQRRGADLVPDLEKALKRSVTIQVRPEAQAIFKYVRISPTKLRRVMDEVRG